ncbi:MAG: MarR family winged helix-turn-helix transcriptional regulator [Acidimicrobiales bacterium]
MSAPGRPHDTRHDARTAPSAALDTSALELARLDTPVGGPLVGVLPAPDLPAPDAEAVGDDRPGGAGGAAGVDAEIIDLLFAVLGLMKQHFVGVIGEFGLTAQQAHALRCLVPGRPLPMRELAAELMCDASTVTGIVDRLEERGLVERRPAQDDRRVKALVVTDLGIAARDRLWQSLLAHAPHLVALSASERLVLRDLLVRVVTANGIDAFHAGLGPSRPERSCR